MRQNLQPEIFIVNNKIYILCKEFVYTKSLFMQRVCFNL